MRQQGLHEGNEGLGAWSGVPDEVLRRLFRSYTEPKATLVASLVLARRPLSECLELVLTSLFDVLQH
jgi:hypothetical protein